MDIGFGDVVEPAPARTAYPAILSHVEPPMLRIYPPETVIAEKLQAMVVLDIRNSRMKDFYDLWYLSRHWPFQMAVLRRAVASTFERRRTEVPVGIPFALTEEFLTDEGKRQQWVAFVRRLNLPADTPDLRAIGQEITKFVHPIFAAGEEDATWQPGGSWQ